MECYDDVPSSSFSGIEQLKIERFVEEEMPNKVKGKSKKQGE
jgi:hypothetical protein